MRPSNWSVLGRSSDPTPGDPVAVRAGGSRYVGIADAISRAAATMRSLEAGASNVDSVKALLESRDKVVDSVGVAEGRYRAAGTALTAYAAVLDRVQADTLHALHAARAAAGDADDAAKEQAKFHQRAKDARDAGDTEEQAKWEKREDAAEQAGSHASGVIAAQKQVVERAVGERDQAARDAIEAFHGATNDGLNDTWWEDWGADVTKIIAEIAETVATIAGLLALLVCWIPVIGQALAGVLLIVAAIAGVVAAIANIILAATGEKSWGEAAMSVVFAVLGCVGLGAAGRAGAAAFKAMMSQAGRIAAKESLSTGAKLSIAMLLRPGALSRISRGNINNVKGALGEEIANIKAYQSKGGFSVPGRSAGRQPDGSVGLGNWRIFGECKNVAQQGVTKQIQDYVGIANDLGGHNLRVFVRSDTALPMSQQLGLNLAEHPNITLVTFEQALGTKIAAYVQAPGSVWNGISAFNDWRR